MSENSCYYYDSEHNRCHCFDNDAEMMVDELSKRIDALERRIVKLENHDLGTAIRVSNVERKLNHKSIETSGESIKIADESIKIGGGE